MSTQQIESVTNAAIRLWQASESTLSFTEFVLTAKARGELWGSREVL